MIAYCPHCGLEIGPAEVVPLGNIAHLPAGVVVFDAHIGEDGALQTPGHDHESHCEKCPQNRRKRHHQPEGKI